MDQEQTWPRSRHSSWSNDGRDGGSPSPRRMHHSGSPSHNKYRPSKPPVWDDTVNDLASMRLTPAEMARKLASRQSTNMMVARAQLLEQTRRSGAQSLSLPPMLAARLQAARQQSVDSILAQSSSTLLASQRVRQTEAAAEPGEEEAHYLTHTANVRELAAEAKREEARYSPHRHDRGHEHTDGHRYASNARVIDDEDKEKRSDQAVQKIPDQRVRASSQSGSPRRVAEHRQAELRPTKDVARPLDISQIVATRTSLDHTINMVVNTCRELWLQLEEERLTREHLQLQLQQQGNVITTLTAELLQIQDQQEAILQEVSDARASGLWGTGELELEEDESQDYMLSGHITPERVHESRSNHYQTSSRHPPRSILRATRTIHPPHQRQPPQSSGRTHESQTHQSQTHQSQTHQSQTHQSQTHQSQTHQTNHPAPPIPQRAPHSPRPHQPMSRSHTHSLQMQRPSPPPEPPLSPRPESASLASYKASISRQIRNALGSEQSVAGARERNASTMPLGYTNISQDSLQQDVNDHEESQATLEPVNKENFLMRGGDLPIDSPLPDQGRMKQ